MATTFNFTVRAEDDQGAFADRDFSISVKNTVVDRYMVVDATDAYTSPDMVTWTKRIGQGGTSVQYGGGKWMVPYGTTWTYRLSTDGVNFVNITPSFVNPKTTSTVSSATFLHPPMWNGSHWWASVNASGKFILIKSADGINWSFVVELLMTTIGVPSFVGKSIFYVASATTGTYFEYDTNVEQNTTSLITPTALSHPNIASARTNYTAPHKFNDLWVVLATTNTGEVYPIYSLDKVSWNLGPAVSGGSSGKNLDQIVYHNGVLIAQGLCVGGGNGVSAYVYSSDGKIWTSKNTGSSVAGVAGVRQNFVTTKGKTWCICLASKRSSVDLGENWVDTPISGLPTSVNGFATIR